MPPPVQSATMEQWAGPPQPPQQVPYMEHNVPGMMNTSSGHPVLDPHPAVTHDADILQAAQLLLPGNFRDAQAPGKLSIWHHHTAWLTVC